MGNAGKERRVTAARAAGSGFARPNGGGGAAGTTHDREVVTWQLHQLARAPCRRRGGAGSWAQPGPSPTSAVFVTPFPDTNTHTPRPPATDRVPWPAPLRPPSALCGAALGSGSLTSALTLHASPHSTPLLPLRPPIWPLCDTPLRHPSPAIPPLPSLLLPSLPCRPSSCHPSPAIPPLAIAPLPSLLCRPSSCHPSSCHPSSCRPSSCRPSSCHTSSCHPSSCRPSSCHPSPAIPPLASPTCASHAAGPTPSAWTPHSSGPTRCSGGWCGAGGPSCSSRRVRGCAEWVCRRSVGAGWVNAW